MLGGMEPLVINPSTYGMSGTYPTLSSLFTGSDIKNGAESKCQVSMNTYFISYAHGKGKEL